MGPGLFADGQTDEPMVYLIPCLQTQYNAQLRNRLFPMEKSIPMFSQAKFFFFLQKKIFDEPKTQQTPGVSFFWDTKNS